MARCRTISPPNNIIVDEIADGINFHPASRLGRGEYLCSHHGDDALAMWSDKIEDANNTFDHNTVQTPVLANASPSTVARTTPSRANLVADPIRKGSGLQVWFPLWSPAVHRELMDNEKHTTVRSGPVEAEKLEHRPGPPFGSSR